MENKLKEKLDRAVKHLNNKEFNEGLLVLQDWPAGNPEIENLKQKIELAKRGEIESILQNLRKAQDQKKWQEAFKLSREAQALDSDDKKVLSAVDRLRDAFAKQRHEEEINRQKQRAKNLLKQPQKTIADIDTALRMLEEIITKEPGELDAESFLYEAQRLRSEFLRSIGQVATFEQAGELEDALKTIEDLIARGLSEYDGENIFEYRARLEKKAREFAEEKGRKYLEKAEKALEEKNPQLALRYIETGIELPGLPKERRDAFKDLKIKGDHDAVQYGKVEEQVKEARRMMNARQYEQAISKLEDALAAIPGFPRAQTYLELARQNLKDKILQDARVVIARVDSEISKGDFEKSRKELLSAVDSLRFEGDEVDELRSRCKEIQGEIDRWEQNQFILERAIKEAKTALRNDDLATAQLEIESLDKELQKRPEVREIRNELTRKQGVEDAFNKAKQAYEDGDIPSAREQIKILKRRFPHHEDIVGLYKEIESTFHFTKGTENFEKLELKEAKKAFDKVLELEMLYMNEARDYLEKIKESSDQDRQAKQKYNTAQRLSEANQYNEAYHLLTEVEELPSFVKSEAAKLLVSVRSKWRTQLIRQIKSCLRAKAYDKVIDLANSLEEIQQAEDSALINDAHKNYHIHQAGIAARQQNWILARQHWEEAQNYDVTDDRINKGLREAKKHTAFREAAAAENELEVIRILEEVVERQESTLDDIDYKIEERLYQAYLLAGEFSRALGFAGKRLHLNEKLSAKAKTIRALCVKLNDSKFKKERGAYAESVDILKKCRKRYSEYSGIIQDLCEEQTDEVIESLLSEAKELERKNESVVHIITKYGELLDIEPDHMIARKKYDSLLTRFNRNIPGLVQEAITTKEDKNISAEEIEYLINKIHDAMTIAGDDQKAKLEPHLATLIEKQHYVRALQKKLIQIEAYFAEAKETGDFSTLDMELNDETIKRASELNREYRKLLKKIHDAKERRKKCEDLAAKLEKAFAALDFPEIERLSNDLKRVDKDDEFSIQRQRLKFEDTFKEEGEIISFNELKGWARDRRQNLERLTAWFNDSSVDKEELEEREKQKREDFEIDFDYEKLAAELQNLAREYRNGADRLITHPETPSSKPAEKIVRNSQKMITQSRKKAEKLEEEARTLRKNEADVKQLVDEAGKLINDGKYSQAQPYVEDGLKLVPTHKVLRHYKELIKKKI